MTTQDGSNRAAISKPAMKRTPKVTAPQKKYDRDIKELAGAADVIAPLLWQKAIAQSSPEVRKILFTWKSLSVCVDDILPDRAAFVPKAGFTFGHLRDYYAKGCDLLTGATPDIFSSD